MHSRLKLHFVLSIKNRAVGSGTEIADFFSRYYTVLVSRSSEASEDVAVQVSDLKSSFCFPF